MSIKYAYKGYILNGTIFADAVRRARIAGKLTQDDLGEMVGLTGSTISNIECGHVMKTLSMSNYLKVCNVLDIDPRAYWELEA